MADLLFGGFGVMPVARRKERRFSLPDNFSISDYTDDELHEKPISFWPGVYCILSGHTPGRSRIDLESL